MKEYKAIPNGWVCTLLECPPGHFMFEEHLCFKTEYRTDNGELEVFCESGEAFWGGTSNFNKRDKLIVQPVIIEKEEK